MKPTLHQHQSEVVERTSEGKSTLVYHSLGSGKSLTSLAAVSEALKDEPDQEALFVVPASLRTNILKEMAKHRIPADIASRIHVTSYEGAKKHADKKYKVVVLDEAHKIRNAGKIEQTAQKILENADVRMLMTATPIYNQRHDIARLINRTAADNVMPLAPNDFDNKFIRKEKVDPNIFLRMMGVTPGEKLHVKNTKELADIGKKYLHHYDAREGMSDAFPSVTHETIKVDMSPEQLEAYEYAEGSLPAAIRWKVRMNMPLSKREASDLNAFSIGVRQASNTDASFTTKEPKSTKIDKAVQDLVERARDIKDYRGVVYSNFLGSGLHEFSRKLEEEGVSHRMFTGGLNDKARKEIVDDYNDGKYTALLISTAGTEGLDLKGTRSVQILDPHFNNEKINQAVGRGVRYLSHSHLPEEDRKVEVLRYLSTKPNFLKIFSRGMGIDEYLTEASAEKDELHAAILRAMTSKL